MTSVVTFVRILNAIQGRRTSSGAPNVLSGHAVFQRPARATRKAATVVLAGGAGFFLGGLDNSPFLLHEIGSSVSHQVSRSLSVLQTMLGGIHLNFLVRWCFVVFHQSTYQKVELKEVPRSLDPRYRSSQE